MDADGVGTKKREMFAVTFKKAAMACADATGMLNNAFGKQDLEFAPMPFDGGEVCVKLRRKADKSAVLGIFPLAVFTERVETMRIVSKKDAQERRKAGA